MSEAEVILFERYLLGELTRQEKATLAQRLDREPELREALVRYMEESHEIVTALRNAGTASEPVPVSFRQANRDGRRSWILRAGIAAALVLTVFSIGLLKLNRNKKSAEVAWTPATVGRVIGVEGIPDHAGDFSFQPGNLVPTGRHLLRAGLAEVMLDNGSSVVLQGPVEVEFIDTDHIRLLRGRLTGHAPGEGVTLDVLTPTLDVVDLGTRFGVEVNEAGSTEVHVLEGSVQVTDQAGDNQIVTEGQALVSNRVGDSTPKPAPLDRTRFSAPPKPSPPQPAAFVHYSFDDAEWLKDNGHGVPGGPFPLLPASPPEAAKPIAGRFGQAAALQRTYSRSDTLRSHFAGIGGNQPRTVALWVKVRERRRNMTLIGWGIGKPGAKWHLTLHNRQGTDRSVLRTSFGRGHVAGTTDLADGNWHHVVSVYLGGNRGSVAQRIRHYVDGQLEEVSSAHKEKIDTQHLGNQRPTFYLGNNFKKINGFTGLMDEVHVFDRALTPEEIRRLHETNRITP